MKCFVTGGSGFIGRNLIQMLKQRGDEVLDLARSDAAAASVKEAGGEPVHGDTGLAHCMERGGQLRGRPDGY